MQHNTCYMLYNKSPASDVLRAAFEQISDLRHIGFSLNEMLTHEAYGVERKTGSYCNTYSFQV